jgi:hypothetical protein
MQSGNRKKLLKGVLVLMCLGLATVAMSTPARAQTICNSQLVVGFPNGDNLNRLIGQTVRMSLTITNGPSQNAGVSDPQTFSLIDFFPSCLSVSGGVCTVDPGANAGAPPPIQYNNNLSQGTCPAMPIANTSNPFDIQFSLSPPFTFANTAGCTFSFDVLVTEAGSDGTPLNIQQAANTNGVCNSTLTSNAGGSSAITLTCPVCDDGNACNGLETCNANTGQCVPGTPVNCDDSNACTTDACVPASGQCTHTPQSPSVCDDSNACTVDACVPATGQCSHTPQSPSVCDDSNACTTDACVPATGQCTHTPQSPSVCNDNDVCTVDACVPATGQCSHTPQPPSFCDDNDECTEDVCVPQEGCTHPPADPLPPSCAETICRTPGFWGTHAGTEKSPGNGQPAVNITEAVIDCADGNCADHTGNDFLLICGERIDSPDSDPADGTTDVDDAASSTEAMCVNVQGDSRLQLARQLTAAALNCLISGGGADCAGTGSYTTVFDDCNAACSDASASKSDITACISQLDCLNNGGSFDNGICGPGGPNNCHERILVNESLGLDFDPPGSAGSSKACQAANKTDCTVVGPHEADCDHDSLP